MKQKYLLLTMILFVFFFLFFATSLALIPGDFGSAGGGPPDGVVDFEDLMIFAMAYGSTPSDANWNEVCDIAGPDGVIDFEDLMIFAMHYGEEAQVIIPDTTEIIDQETEQVVTSVSEDQSSIIFSHSTTQTDRIDPGDIIVMGVTDQTPYGLLRRVTNINKGLTKGSQVILDTEFTTLEEAIQKGHWEYDHTLKPEDIEKGFVFPEGIQPVRGKASTSLDFEYQIDLILYDQDDNPDTIENNIMATGYLAFNYQIIFDGDIDGFTLKYFIFKNIIQAESKLEISVGASVSIADLADIGDLTIGKPIPFTPVTVPCPPPAGFPLVFFPSIELKVGLEGEAYIKLTTGIRQTASYTAGIEFTEGNWDNITTPPQVDYYEDPIEVNGGIHVIAHAGPQLNCKLYKVAGPYCNIFGYLDFEADTTLDPWWDLDAGLKVSAGVKVDILAFHWESDELEVINLPVDIADAGGPFGSTGPVHNLSQGTYYDTIQAALDDADSNNTIEVSDGTYNELIAFPENKAITLQSVNGPEYTIIDGSGLGDSVVTINHALEGTIIEGITITGGNTDDYGGGINLSASYLTLTNCTITNNSATIHGGGISTVSVDQGPSSESYLTLIDCTITNNSATNHGGGIESFHGILTLTNCTITNNSTGLCGGGIEVYCGTFELTNCTITNNSANHGGGMRTFQSISTLTNCTITNNSANSGGGIFSDDKFSMLPSGITITDCTINENSAVNQGGGIYLYKPAYEIQIIGNQLRFNSGAYSGGGVYIYEPSVTPTIVGNTLCGNICDNVATADNQIYPNNYPDNDISATCNSTYALRDIGPAGGYIFYDKGTYSDGWRYLEAAPASTEWTGKQWGSYGTYIGGTGAGIGTGQSNTTIIVTWLNSHSETDRAAQLCDTLVYGGYSDWFLPSKDELNLMYTKLHLFGVGGFSPGGYWSSSESTASFAWNQGFGSGIPVDGNKGINIRVWAVRAF